MFGFLCGRRCDEAFGKVLKRTQHIYNAICDIPWGWSRWTGPPCCGAFYRPLRWNSCAGGKGGTMYSIRSLLAHPLSYSPNEEVVLLMELTWNQIWTSQKWLWHLDCPPRRTPQKLPPSCHTIELLHAAHCKAFKTNQWQVTYTRTLYGSYLLWLHYQNTLYICIY